MQIATCFSFDTSRVICTSFPLFSPLQHSWILSTLLTLSHLRFKLEEIGEFCEISMAESALVLGWWQEEEDGVFLLSTLFSLSAEVEQNKRKTMANFSCFMTDVNGWKMKKALGLNLVVFHRFFFLESKGGEVNGFLSSSLSRLFVRKKEWKLLPLGWTKEKKQEGINWTWSTCAWYLDLVKNCG